MKFTLLQGFHSAPYCELISSCAFGCRIGRPQILGTACYRLAFLNFSCHFLAPLPEASAAVAVAGLASAAAFTPFLNVIAPFESCKYLPWVVVFSAL